MSWSPFVDRISSSFGIWYYRCPASAPAGCHATTGPGPDTGEDLVAEAGASRKSVGYPRSDAGIKTKEECGNGVGLVLA
jgi:hypothetical protein